MPGRPEHDPVPGGRAPCGRARRDRPRRRTPRPRRSARRGGVAGRRVADEAGAEQGAGGVERVARRAARARTGARRRPGGGRPPSASGGHQSVEDDLRLGRDQERRQIATKAGMAPSWRNCPMLDPSSAVPDVAQERRARRRRAGCRVQEVLVQDEHEEHQQQEALHDAQHAAQDLVDHRVLREQLAPSCRCPGRPARTRPTPATKSTRYPIMTEYSVGYCVQFVGEEVAQPARRSAAAARKNENMIVRDADQPADRALDEAQDEEAEQVEDDQDVERR